MCVPRIYVDVTSGMLPSVVRLVLVADAVLLVSTLAGFSHVTAAASTGGRRALQSGGADGSASWAGGPEPAAGVPAPPPPPAATCDTRVRSGCSFQTVEGTVGPADWYDCFRSAADPRCSSGPARQQCCATDDEAGCEQAALAECARDPDCRAVTFGMQVRGAVQHAMTPTRAAGQPG